MHLSQPQRQPRARPEPARPDISVCVAAYKHHGAPNLRTLSESLAAAADGLSYELVAVLNGIDLDFDERPSGSPVYVRFAVNRGVSAGWNAAVAASSGSLVCVINDDVALGPGSLRVLAESLATAPAAGVTGPVGTRWDIPAARHISYVDTVGKPVGTVVECEVVSGFLLVFYRTTFDRVGGFDERLTPCSYEEVDFCTAVRLKAGLKCYAVAGVDIAHNFGISAARSWKRISFDGRRETLGSINRRNRRHIVDKWGHANSDRG